MRLYGSNANTSRSQRRWAQAHRPMHPVDLTSSEARRQESAKPPRAGVHDDFAVPSEPSAGTCPLVV